MSNKGQELELARSKVGSVADDLESAHPKQLVYVDRRGEVRSARHYRRVNRGFVAAMVALGGSAVVAYGMLLGASGVGLAAVAVALGSLPWWRYRRVARGVRHLVRDELDQAETQFLAVTEAPLVPKQIRALAWHNLGSVQIRRRQFEAALASQRKARALFQRMWKKPIFSHMADLATVHTLVELGRLGEASALLLEVRENAPDGQYLRLGLWSAELYVAFADGEQVLTADELHRRAIAALQITSAVGLLLLLSWAHWSSGDHDQAAHLYQQALERDGVDLVERSMPRLWVWVEEHDGELGASQASARE